MKKIRLSERNVEDIKHWLDNWWDWEVSTDFEIWDWIDDTINPILREIVWQANENYDS